MKETAGVNHRETGGIGKSQWSMSRIMLMILGACLTIGGIGVWLLVSAMSAVDTGSVVILIGRGDFDTGILRTFQFTAWREPIAEIRPFTFGPKSFEQATIIRYRRGSRICNPLFRQTYYEAEYRMPDGKIVVDAAWGPLPYATPNSRVLFPIIAVGAFLFLSAIVPRRKKTT